MDTNGFWRRLRDSADIGAAQRELAGDRSCLAYTTRGCLALLVAHLELAEACLERATKSLWRAEESTIDPLGSFFHLLNIRELQLLQTGRASRLHGLKECYLGLDRRFRSVLMSHEALNGLAALSERKNDEAEAVFGGLLQEAPRDGSSNRAMWSMGFALAAWNAGRHAEALGRLEAAESETQRIAWPFPALQAGTRLEAIYRIIGDAAHRERWGRFVAAIACPDASRRGFRRRARLIGGRAVLLYA